MPIDLTKNTGVLAPFPDEKEYVLGAVSGIVHQDINTTRDWKQFEPTNEKQRFPKFDSYGCVSFSCTNDVEIQFNLLLKSGLIRQEDIEWLKVNGYFDEKGNINFDDRWLVVLSQTNPNVGNYISAVWDAARVVGLVPQGIGGFREDMTQSEYYDFGFFSKFGTKRWTKDQLREIAEEWNKKAFDLGQEFLKRFFIQYERVLTNEKDLIKALGQAPLHVGLATCTGWEDPTVVSYCGRPANHATLITCIDDLYRWVFDSYPDFRKRLQKDYPVDFAYKGIVTPIVSVGGEKKELYRFTKNLKFGDYDNDVVHLGKRLIEEDVWADTSYNPPGPHYNQEIARAVRNYQKKHKLVNWIEDLWFQGKYFGPKTRLEMNSKINAPSYPW